MELTTGAILRRITRTELSVSAHKLATLILDGIAWKDGYNGLPRGAAAFTLGALAQQMAVSRQYLHVLLGELAASGLRLVRQRLRGRMSFWLFRFGCCDDREATSAVSATDDILLYREDTHKNVFSGMIVLNRPDAPQPDRWLALIGATKATLPCRLADTRHIWEKFLAFNHRRGQDAVPAGYLLGFMRRWRSSGVGDPRASVPTVVCTVTGVQRALNQVIASAPIANRHFHESDLLRIIGADAYRSRVAEAAKTYGCSEFSAKLAVHGLAATAGEIRP